VDELGHRTEFDYDADGRQTVVRDALGDQIKTSYDTAGRAVSTTDALGHTTQFVYDALGRQTQTIYVDGTQTSKTYDVLGRVTAEVDQLNRQTRYEYDALGRLTAVVDALGQRTSYGYDEAGDLVTQTDASGHVTRYEYDKLGRRVATVVPLGERSTTTYDADGNVATATDFNGATVRYDYDVNNRLTAKHFPDGTQVTFTYTATGQTATETDTRGTTTYQYDERDRLVLRTDPDGKTISHGYDAAGNRVSSTTAAGTIGYTFDVLNRLATVTDPDSAVTHYSYDAVGNLVETDLPNGTTEKRTYDNLNRLVFLENRGPSGVISSYRYTLAATGRRDAVVEDTGRQVNYGYDALDRLTQEKITDAVFGNRQIDYPYDPVGNRLSMNDTAAGLTTYSYDADDRLMLESLAGVQTNYTYDKNGNTLSKVTSPTNQALYHWDFENRMTGADVTDTTGTSHITYKYNPDGIRVSSIVNGQETRFLIDTVQPYAEVVLEYQPTGLVVASYVYGNRLISQSRGGAKSFYVVDGLGSTRALTNGGGVVTDRYVYDAFGRTIVQSGSTVNSYLFAGEQRDANVGLDYLRARYLSVGTGRFYGMDPLAAALRSPISVNRFLYGAANPVENVDPTGQLYLEVAVALSALAILSVVYFNNHAGNTPLGSATYTVDSDLNGFVSVTGPQLKAAMSARRPDSNGLLPYAQTFVDVAKSLNINPYYIAAHAAWESGWGTSRIFLEKNNAFGEGAFDESPYGSAKRFDTVEQGIWAVMNRVKSEYLTQGGTHYHGSTLRGMNVDYATDSQWAYGIARAMNALSDSVTGHKSLLLPDDGPAPDFIAVA
jgi:RHS repeat-associated protein